MSRLLALALIVAASTSPLAAATRGYQISDFTRLRVEGPFDVKVRTGVAPGARASGPQALIDRLIVEQHGDTLVIRPVRDAGINWSWSKDNPFVVEVGTHALAAAALTGSGDVAIDRVQGDALDLALGGSGDLSVCQVEVAALKVSMSGSGGLTVAGHTREANALLVGSGDIRGGGLTADTAVVKLMGSGNLALAARRTADVTLGGSGDATVTGPAACTVHRSGSGDVRCGKVASSGD